MAQRQQLPIMLSNIRSTAIDGRLLNPIYRKTLLRDLHNALSDHITDIQDAIVNDTGKQSSEAKAETWLSLQLLADAYVSIRPDQAVKQEYAIARGEDLSNNREPIGIVIVHPSVHCFFFSLMSALVPAFSAGNCVVVQADWSLSQTHSLVLGLISRTLDDDVFFTTDKEIKETDLRHRHIHVLQDGPKNIDAPYRLLSNPEALITAIVERDANIATAAKSLAMARFGLQGSSPYAPDLILVNELVKDQLAAAVVEQIGRFKAEASNNSGRTAGFADGGILHEIQGCKDTDIIFSNPDGTVIDIKNRQSCISQRKVKGRCLALHAVTSMDDAIDLSNSLGRVAASYVFTTNSAAKYICQFLDGPVAFVNHIPLALLFNPIAPENTVYNPKLRNFYTQNLFSVPKASFVVACHDDQILEEALYEKSAQNLSLLDQQASTKIVGFSRPKRGAAIGFFEQGIIIGGILTISISVSLIGVLGYWVARYR
ncbi:Aldehyde/histidinol dehydrogenase [Xylariaceae sp. FL1651]|nr:Aldehyde/histidinol dehydrogenase [Xylariaceae sp. FL1651]